MGKVDRKNALRKCTKCTEKLHVVAQLECTNLHREVWMVGKVDRKNCAGKTGWWAR
jgi:hypothetical protein